MPEENIIQKQENKNNSTLDMSFNQNEIQVLDGKMQLEFELDNSQIKEAQEFRNFMELDQQISETDLVNNRGNLEQS